MGNPLDEIVATPQDVPERRGPGRPRRENGGGVPLVARAEARALLLAVRTSVRWRMDEREACWCHQSWHTQVPLEDHTPMCAAAYRFCFEERG